MKLSVKKAVQVPAVAPPPALKVAQEIPFDLLALAVAKKLKADGPLDPGEYTARGELVLSIDVGVKKGEPVQAHQSFSCDLVAALVAVAESLRIKPSALVTALPDALRSAHAGEVDPLYLETVTPVVERTAREIVDSLPLVDRQGATTVTGDVEILSFEAS